MNLPTLNIANIVNIVNTVNTVSIVNHGVQRVDVEDFEHLRKDELLIRRLRAWVPIGSPSRPIDLDDLATGFEQVPLRSSSLASTIESIDEEFYHLDLAHETDCYNTLIREGGRPSHPVSLGRDVLEDLGQYREIISYWQSGEYDWQVFQRQMGAWRAFLEFQRKHRDKKGDFPQYARAVRQRLEKYGFTRPFQLDEVLERQDKMTTWIEYLDYEYWRYLKDMAFVKLHQPEYNAAWKKLVDSRVLRPGETEESICNVECIFRGAREEEKAEGAVESAEGTMMWAEEAIANPQCSTLSPQYAERRLAAAQSTLDSAVKSRKLIKRRNALLREFFEKIGESQTVDGIARTGYREVKRNAECRSIILRWIVQQIPLIELELSTAKVAENEANKQDQDGGDRRSKHNGVR
ncbi:hypothetical protein B7494_g5510 [Chlorociboria aeruginascens]|nr:hypothetical protein B7494_g5510 [Chlorociboria aeruginascens]